MMSGLQPLRSSKDLGRCLTLPAAAPCRLIVVIGGIYSLTWRVSRLFIIEGVVGV